MTTSQFNPSSLYSPEQNAKTLYQYLRDLHQARCARGQTDPIILIGHSKGGLEIFYTVQKYYDLIELGIVENMLTIQAAIQGSRLIKDDRLWWPLKIVKNNISPWLGGSYQSLDPDYVVPSNDRLVHDFREQCTHCSPGGQLFQNVSDKLHYVLAHEDTENRTLLTRYGVWWCGNDLESEGANDGLLATQDMMHPEIGNILGVFKAEHSELVMTPPSGTLKHLYTYAVNTVISGVRIAEEKGWVKPAYSEWLLKVAFAGKTPEEQKAFIRAAIYEMYTKPPEAYKQVVPALGL